MKLLLLVVSMAALAAIVGQAGSSGGSLAGVVRDEQSAPIEGVHITVASESPQASFTTMSDGQGAYRFASLPAGKYRLETAREGFAPSNAEPVAIVAGAAVALPVMLKRVAPARPEFAAAGLRGLIDPGGYSAAGQAAAASSLIKGVADIQRTGKDATGPAMDNSCALEPALKQEAARKPDSADASLKLGEFYLAHGQAAKALPVLEHAHSLDPNDQQALRQSAIAYRLFAREDEGAGRFVEAAHAYQLAAARDPSEENLFGAGYELILAGLPRDAEQAFAGAGKRIPRSIPLSIGLGSAQFLEGHTAESIETLLRAVDLDPHDPRPYRFLSAATSNAPDHPQTVHTAFERFLNLEPDNPLASYYLALELLHEPSANEVANAGRIEALLRHVVVLDPGLADAHFQLSVLSARQQHYQAAAQELEKTLSLTPDLKEAHYRLAIAYRQTGQADLSAKEMQRFHELQQRSSAQKDGTGADITQFISVLGNPETAAAHGSACPGDPP